MRVLVSDAEGLVGERLIRRLAAQVTVRTLGASRDRDITGDPRDRAVAEQATRDCEAIIHVLPPVAGRPPLEPLDRATRGVYNLLTTATAARRFILLSSLGPFERYPADWLVNEHWAPRPTAAIGDLVPYLAEATLREAARIGPVIALALRLGPVVDDEAVRRGPADGRWLHVDDAVAAVERALAFTPPDDGPARGFWAFHIVGGGPRTRFPLGQAGQADFGYRPQHDLSSAAAWPVATAEPGQPRLDDRLGGAARRVVLFGAGGPLAAATASVLAHDHTLRLTDARPLADIIAEGRPQSPGAPLPQLYPAPHETRVVDVTDLDQVRAATEGMDAIINCTVVRPHPVEAFRVNTLGAYAVMAAAVASGIRRVVHTGPQQVTFGDQAGYWTNFQLGEDVPARPGRHLYILTKYLGQEICRIVAEEHGLEVPTLLFSSFVEPEAPRPEPLGAFPFSVSWADSAAAMRQALRVPSLPHPFELLHIVGDLPHGKYSNEKAKRLLQWQPRDRLTAHWRRSDWGGDG